MPVKLRIDTTGSASRDIADLARRAGDLRVAWDGIGNLMLRSVEKNFAVGGRPTLWPLLSSATLGILLQRPIRRRRAETREDAVARRVTGKKILIDSGLLKNSITYQVLREGVEIGTNVPYGRIHQLGGQAGRGRKVKIPARPYLLVQLEDEPRIQRILGNWIVKGEADV